MVITNLSTYLLVTFRFQLLTFRLSLIAFYLGILRKIINLVALICLSILCENMELSLTHQFVLLSVNEKGGFSSDAFISMNFGMAGAILSELTLARFIEIRDEKVYASENTTGILVYDEVLRMIRTQKKQKSVQYWVSRLAYRMRKIKRLALYELGTLGIVTIKERKVLGVFKRFQYFVANKTVKMEMELAIRSVLLHDASPTVKQVLLISLISSCNMLNTMFPEKEERKMARLKSLNILEKKFQSVPVTNPGSAKDEGFVESSSLN